MAGIRTIILMPSFNTGPILREALAAALTTSLPLWLVIDGSTDGPEKILDGFQAEQQSGQLRVIRLPQNVGKGAAVLVGLRQALEQGITHLLTMDADGQHPAAAVAEFLRLSRAHPEAAILGRPVFDRCAPAIRVNGRKLSNFWTHVETLGWGIDDSLFGMRLYPAQPLLEVMESTRYARRFDFEPEVAVRLAWRGVPVVNLPTAVRYPKPEDGGISQFRYFRDNVLLTWMHLRLFASFWVRLPKLMIRDDNPLLHVTPEARPPVSL